MVVPRWLWRLSGWSLALAAAAVAAGAAALVLGTADPPRAGPLLWQDDFKAGLARWELLSAPGGSADTSGAALAFTVAPGQTAYALTAGPTGDFTLEVAGAAGPGAGEAAYGLVFAWQDPAHYSAVLVSGNGYAEAYTQLGPTRETWFVFQQWPHILYGVESNRVRVDGRGATVTARVNDEVLAATSAAGGGRVGVLVSSPAAARVVFSWVRVWTP
ncbi:MAG: hypothetical protein IT317_11960 [Anaerolineales bacterium]|nr:hypothetical protein [Anaerolineales bacterium]